MERYNYKGKKAKRSFNLIYKSQILNHINNMKTQTLKQLLLMITLFIATSFSIYAQKGNGNITTQERKVDDFKNIELSGTQKIILLQGETPGVKVETDENLQEKVQFLVKDGSLEIDTKGMGEFTKLVITVTCKEISEITTTGVTEVKAENEIRSDKLKISASGASNIDMNINVKDLETNLSGAANVKLTGRANTNNASVSGAGILRAADLVTEKTLVKVSGVGKAKINATNEVKGGVTGAGEISCKNKPPVYEVNEMTADSEDAGTHPGDTTRFNFGNKKMIIIDEDGNKKDLGEDKEDSHFDGNMFKNKKNKTKIYWAGINIGVNGYLNNEYGLNLRDEYRMDLNYGKSWFVDINFLEFSVPIVKKYMHLVTGAGFEFTNYRFDMKVKPIPDHAEFFLMQPDTSSSLVKTKLSTTYFQIPLLLQFDTKKIKKNNTFHLSLGVIGGVRVESHSKQVYSYGKTRDKDKSSDRFDLSPFTAAATVRVGYGPINLFATYNFTKMFKSNYSPELYPFTIGITLLNL